MLYTVYFLEAGLLLVLVPWSSYWDGNYFTHVVPLLRDVLGNHFVRGAVTGLGLLNLGVAFGELRHLGLVRRRATSGDGVLPAE